MSCGGMKQTYDDEYDVKSTERYDSKSCLIKKTIKRDEFYGAERSIMGISVTVVW